MTDTLGQRLAVVDATVQRANLERAYASDRAFAADQAATAADAEVRAADVALTALHHVRDITSAQVADTITSLCSEGLRLVFDDPGLRLEARSVERRGVVETDLVLVRNGLETSPLESNGGGLVAVASAMLRLVLVRLMSKRGLAPLLVLDEPLAALSAGHREQMAAVLREVAADLGVQTIIVTHESELAEQGDTWTVRWKDRDVVLAEVVRSDA